MNVYECFGTRALDAYERRTRFESTRVRMPIIGVLREREVTRLREAYDYAYYESESDDERGENNSLGLR